jgi:hypothetical protein
MSCSGIQAQGAYLLDEEMEGSEARGDIKRGQTASSQAGCQALQLQTSPVGYLSHTRTVGGGTGRGEKRWIQHAAPAPVKSGTSSFSGRRGRLGQPTHLAGGWGNARVRVLIQQRLPFAPFVQPWLRISDGLAPRLLFKHGLEVR